jgi:hypothetical protein
VQSTRKPRPSIYTAPGTPPPGSHGFRAEFAKPACLFLLARDFAIPLDDLRQLAAYYRVPVLRPHTTDLREYRKVLNGDPLDYELDQLLAEGDFPDPISQELRNQPTHSPVRSWTPPPAPPPPQLPARSLSRGDKVEYRGSQYEVADSAWTDYARDGGATVTLKLKNDEETISVVVMNGDELKMVY